MVRTLFKSNYVDLIEKKMELGKLKYTISVYGI